MLKFAVTVVTVLFAVQSHAKSMSEYWAELNLPTTLFTSGVSTKGCYRNLESFLGCIHGSNAVLGGKRLAIFPASRVAGHPLVKRVVGEWGNLRLVEVGAQAPARTLAEAVARAKKERDDSFSALKEAFADKENRADFGAVKEYLERNVFLENARTSELVAQGINGYLGASLDPHTRISPKKYFDDERAASSSSFVGIGIQLRELDGEVVVIQPIEGGPAHRAGIRAKDVVTHVDGRPLAGRTLEESMALVKGPEGTEITVRVRRRDGTKDIRVKRAMVTTKNVVAKMLDDDRRRIGYVKLNGFVAGKPGAEVKAAVEELKNARAEAIVFDMRGNPGGLIDQAVEVANVFLGNTMPVVIQKPLSFGFPMTFSTREDAVTDLPLTTLIDARSASASELVSGALQDHRRGLVVGERSYGKGTVQGVRPWDLAEGVLMIRTQATFHMPSGRSNQLVGIVPDVTVYRKPNPTEEDKLALREEDTYLNALPATSEAFKPLQGELIARVSDCMAGEGRATALFADRQEDAIPPDYQLLAAQDTAVCQLR